MPISSRVVVFVGVAAAPVLFLLGMSLAGAAVVATLGLAGALVAEAWVREGPVFVRRGRLLAAYGSVETAERMAAAGQAGAARAWVRRRGDTGQGVRAGARVTAGAGWGVAEMAKEG